MDGSIYRVSLQELAVLIRNPYVTESFSAISECPYVLVDFNLPTNLNRADYQYTCDQLHQLSCPIIAIIPQSLRLAFKALAEIFDLVVADDSSVGIIIRNIQQNPSAAMTLVQLARHNARVNDSDALLAESLAYATLQGGLEFKKYITRADRPALIHQTNFVEPMVKVERFEKELAIVLNRPTLGNPFTSEMRESLFEGLCLLASDETIEKAIISGAGDNFCIGGYYEDSGVVSDTATAHAIRSARSVSAKLIENRQRIEFHLQGKCIGAGIELPAFASHVRAERDTVFQLPEITMGLVPGTGGTLSILKRIGRQRFCYFALSAEIIESNTALEWGLIDKVC